MKKIFLLSALSTILLAGTVSFVCSDDTLYKQEYLDLYDLERFNTCDTNKDGILTVDELKNEQKGFERFLDNQRFKHADTNSDGVLSLEECKAERRWEIKKIKRFNENEIAWLVNHPNFVKWIDKHPWLANDIYRHPHAAYYFYKHPHFAKWCVNHPKYTKLLKRSHAKWVKMTPAKKALFMKNHPYASRRIGKRIEKRGKRLEHRGKQIEKAGERLEEKGYEKKGKALQDKGERMQERGKRKQRRGKRIKRYLEQ